MKTLVIFFLSFNLYANETTPYSTAQFLEEINVVIDQVVAPPEEPCIDCKVEDNLISEADPLPTTFRRGSLYFNKMCENFVKEDGSLGVWGDMIVNYIENTEGASDIYLYDEVRGMTASPYTCPNWYNLNNQQRKRFWVWMFASIAQVESSCDPTKVNTGPVPDATDRPTGLFQLNQVKRNRMWRGENCKFETGYTATIKPENQIKCSMDIMMEILKGRRGIYRGSGRIFPTNSYWEKLRPNHSQTGGPIGELVRNYPPCKATP